MLAFDPVLEARTSQPFKNLLIATLKDAAARGERDTSHRGWSELEQAFIIWNAGHGEIVSDLSENGASINAKEIDCCTPLHIAVRGEDGSSAAVGA